MAAADYYTQVYTMFVGYFGRPPAQSGLDYYANLVNAAGGKLNAVLDDFHKAAESQAQFAGKTIEQQVNIIFQNLFGRDAAPTGLNYWAGEIAAGRLALSQAAYAIAQGAQTADKAVLTAKVDSAKLWVAGLDTTNEILAYGNESGRTAGRDFLKTVTTSTPAAQTAVDAALKAMVDGGNVNPGQTYTLTTGVDNIPGTVGNDTIIADNTGATKQLSAADQINGGNGTDLLKVYLAAGDTGTGQPTLTSIEQVWINGGAITAYSAASGTTSLTVEAPVANTAATYTLTGQELTLKSVASTANTTTTVAKGATGTQTSQKITLNGVTAATGTANTIDVTGAGITTLNLVATGSNSAASLANTGGAAITTINVSGDKNLTLTESAGMAAAVTTIDASTATGNVSVDTSAAAVSGSFKFTGGAGSDNVKFADNALAALLSGAQLNGGNGTADKISILDTTLSATETARINQATGFEVLGLNANISVDASTLTAIKSFSVDTTALTQTISNMATGSTTTITAAAPTSLTLGTNVGVTDTSIVLGTATSAGITVGTLVTTGITNVTLTSNGLAANAITTLTNSDNSVFTIKGAQDLTLSLSAGTAVASKIDGALATGKLTLTGSALTGSGDIIIGGSGNDTLNGSKGADTLTGGAGADTFSFTATVGANAGGTAFGQADVITDFVIGTDKLQFAGVADVVSGQQGAVQAAVTALAAGSSATAIATAMATANSTANGVSFAVFEGNTYVLFETTAAGTGVAADDVFIKLTGVATLPTFAADVIA